MKTATTLKVRRYTNPQLAPYPSASSLPSTSSSSEQQTDPNNISEPISKSTTTSIYQSTAEEVTESSAITVDGCSLPVVPRQDKNVKTEEGVRFGSRSDSRHEFFISSSLKSSLTDESIFSIDFRTSGSNGLILYVSGSNDIDFVTIFMSEGYIYSLWNCGGGSAMIQSKKTFNDDAWHTVTLERKLRKGSLSIDDIEIGVEESPGDASSLNVKNPIFVGGIPDSTTKQTRSNLRGMTTSFPGCIRGLFVQGIQLGFFIDSQPFSAPVCSSLVEPGFFFHSSHDTFSGHFLNGGYSSNGGHNSEGRNSGSSGTYAILRDKFRVGESITIKMWIKPRTRNGIILSVRGSKDFLLIQMLEGKIKLSVDNGAGVISVESGVPAGGLCDGEWHSILGVKEENIISLSIDSSDRVQEVGIGDVYITDTNSPLYIGGVPEEDTNTTGLDTREHFVGCIRDVVISDQPMSFLNSTIKGHVTLNTCPTI